MALEQLEQQGHEALVDEDFERALELYSQALSLDPCKPLLLVRRAQAHIKLGHFADALADSQRAIELNPSLAKAYLQKGIACFSLKQYDTAKSAFEEGSQLESSASFQSWILKCSDKLKADGQNSAPPAGNVAQTSAPPATPNDALMVPAAPSHRPSLKCRHEWYQNAAEVVVTIFVRGINPDDANIEFGEQLLSVMINVPNCEPFVLQTRLYGKVNVPLCKYDFLSTKIEIRLRKAEEIRWNALEFEKRAEVIDRAPVSEPTKAPSSSRKNWDRIEAEVKKEEKDEKLEGDAALNKLFREIYSNADEDTRRAMNKSFVESNGTVLSTNWSEVGSKTVEGSAPQGMEMRKWDV